jgi:hypothetical protein
MTRSDTLRPPIIALRKVHSITSSAIESTSGRTSMPSARRLQVDDELEFGRLLHQVCGLRAFEDFVGAWLLRRRLDGIGRRRVRRSAKGIAETSANGPIVVSDGHGHAHAGA